MTKRIRGKGTPVERFFAHVRCTDSCWLWEGAKNTDGYGLFGNGARVVVAHRFAYETFVAPIPAELEIDHRCRVQSCVNPAHLEPVTHVENVRRHYATVTRCANGHDFTTQNTYRRPSGHRDCRVCIRARAKAYRIRKAAEVA